MSEVAEQNYHNAGRVAKETLAFIEAMLLAYVEKKEFDAKYQHLKAFADWIKDGGECCFYNAQGNSTNELRELMIKEKIAFIELTNEKDQFIIKAPDLERVKELNRGILIARQNYFQEVDTVEMEDAIARFDKLDNKEILTINDIDPVAKEAIKNKCNDISKGFMVGVRKQENENFAVSVGAGKVLSSNNKNDFCKAYIAAMHSVYGLNQDVKEAQVEFDSKTLQEILNLKESDEVKFIVGANDKDIKNYIELNSEGFISYSASKDDEGKLVEKVIESCRKNDINYDSELQRQLDSIMDIAILDNSAELNQHLMSDDGIAESKRRKKTFEEERISSAEDEVVDIVDSMIKEKIETEDLSFATSSDEFAYYINESSKIFDAVIEGKEPVGYTKESIDNINKIYDSVGYEKEKIAKIREKIKKPLDSNNISEHQARRKVEKEVTKAREEHWQDR